MINFLKKKKENINNNSDFLSKVASLLIHAAKIDEVYTDDEKKIIKKTLIKPANLRIKLASYISALLFE